VQIERVAPYLWRIPADAAPGMRVPALVVADEPLMRQIRTDAALAQLANGATLPGIVRAALAMPDIHQGYGLPVGGVVATDAAHGVVSPGAIGFDINCGVRLLRPPHRRRAARARRGRPRGGPPGAGRGDAGGLQGREGRGGRRPSIRDLVARGTPAPDGRHQGLTGVAW
jgi:tRNA-splicing ligase RtcB